MPRYRVTLSDGRIATVEADAPPSAEDVLAALGTSSPSMPADATIGLLAPSTPSSTAREAVLPPAMRGGGRSTEPTPETPKQKFKRMITEAEAQRAHDESVFNSISGSDDLLSGASDIGQGHVARGLATMGMGGVKAASLLAPGAVAGAVGVPVRAAGRMIAPAVGPALTGIGKSLENPIIGGATGAIGGGIAGWKLGGATGAITGMLTGGATGAAANLPIGHLATRLGKRLTPSAGTMDMAKLGTSSAPGVVARAPGLPPDLSNRRGLDIVKHAQTAIMSPEQFAAARQQLRALGVPEDQILYYMTNPAAAQGLVNAGGVGRVPRPR